LRRTNGPSCGGGRAIPCDTEAASAIVRELHTRHAGRVRRATTMVPGGGRGCSRSSSLVQPIGCLACRARVTLPRVSMPLTTTHGVRLRIRKCAGHTRYTCNRTPATAKDYSYGGRPGRRGACGARGGTKANKRNCGNRRGQQVPKSNWSMEEYVCVPSSTPRNAHKVQIST
jgi:hypothetical protein